MANISYIESQLQKIEDIHSRNVTDYSEMKAALIAELELYRDLIPGYKIKTRGSAAHHEGNMKKKDVIVIERFEQTLLQQYEKYLEMLMRICEKKHPESQSLGSRCVAELLGFASHFNYNQTLVRAAVSNANSKVTGVARPCLDALKAMFDSEEADEPALQAVDAMVEIVKERQHALNPKLLYTLLHLRVKVVDMHRTDGNPHKKKDKRAKKEEDRAAKAMQKAEGTKSKGDLAASQTRLLQKVITVYLRVLDASRHCSELHQSLLLAPTLEGLGKYAHLMNVELHDLLLAALKDIIEDTEHTSITVALHSLVTVATLAEHQTPAEGMARADLQAFHNALYRLVGQALELPLPDKTTAPAMDGDADEEPEEVPDTASSVGGQTTFSIARSMAERKYVQSSPPLEWVYRAKLAMYACDMMLVKVKRLPPLRIAAFVRKLSLYTVCSPSHIAAGILRLIQKLCLMCPLVTGMVLGGSDNAVGSGEFLMEAVSPDHANASSSFLWELRALRVSHHPALKSMANQMLKEYAKAKKRSDLLAQVTGTHDDLDPVAVMLKYDTSKGGFSPQPQAPKRTRAQLEE